MFMKWGRRRRGKEGRGGEAYRMKHVFTTQIRYAIVVVVVVSLLTTTTRLPLQWLICQHQPLLSPLSLSLPLPLPLCYLENCNCALLLARSDCVYETFRAVNFKRNAAINRTEIAQKPRSRWSEKRERKRSRQREVGEGESGR